MLRARMAACSFFRQPAASRGCAGHFVLCLIGTFIEKFYFITQKPKAARFT
jgi:hypothetical protein